MHAPQRSLLVLQLLGLVHLGGNVREHAEEIVIGRWKGRSIRNECIKCAMAITH